MCFLRLKPPTTFFPAPLNPFVFSFPNHSAGIQRVNSWSSGLKDYPWQKKKKKSSPEMFSQSLSMLGDVLTHWPATVKRSDNSQPEWQQSIRVTTVCFHPPSTPAGYHSVPRLAFPHRGWHLLYSEGQQRNKEYTEDLPGAKLVVPKNLMVPILWPTTNTLSPGWSSPSQRELLVTDVAEEFKPVWRIRRVGVEWERRE